MLPIYGALAYAYHKSPTFREGVKNFGRNLPVIGNAFPDEKVDQNTIDTGSQYYDQPASNARELYNQALARSQASYQAGNIRDIDLAGANALQGRQTANLDALQGAVNGPSVAQQQYQAALGQSRNAAMGMVAASRGAGRGAGRLQAASQFGGQAGVQAAQAGALAGQERTNNLAQYTAALQGARGQDIGLATDRAGLMLNRDMASDAAGRNAFQATHNVQQGYLGAAGQALGQQAGIAGGQAQTAQAQYTLAREEEDRRRKGHAANRQAITGGVQQGAQMAAGRPPGV